MAPKQRQFFKVIVPGKGWPDVHYQNKMEAKRSCQHYIANGNHAVICRGSEHWRGESFNKTKHTRGRGS